jgi:hypothetical protein
MAVKELPTTRYMGSPNPTVIRGTMKGPPPKPNMEATIASKKAPIHPKIILTLNSCPQNSTIMRNAPYILIKTIN